MAFARIEEGPKRGSCTASAEDGSSFIIPSSLLPLYHLRKDQQLSESEYLSLKETITTRLCRDKAVTLIARRDHGRRELIIKLIQKGFNKETAGTVTDALCEQGVLDDVKFAYQFILSRQRRNPEGISLLKMRLKEKGVSSEDIEKAVTQYLEDGTYHEDIARAAAKLARKGSSKELLEAKLRRKGFSSREYREILEESEID